MFEVLILEDEENTLEYLLKIVGEIPQVTAIYPASRGADAIALAQKYQPDCALLDIGLSPGDLDGLTVAKSIFSTNPDCTLVFVTGFAEYALQSFSVHPYDFVVKPVNKNRLKKVLTEIIAKAAPQDSQTDTIVFRKKGEFFHLNQNDILFIEKFSKEAHIHTSDGVVTVFQALNEIENALNEHFFRSHKSFIINLDKVQKVCSDSSRSYSVSFVNYDREAMMSRYKYNRYLEILANSSPQ